jgi:glutamate-1-semialdehyde 2,1-aminomutase
VQHGARAATVTDSSASKRFMERACASIAAGDSSTMRVMPYALPLVADRGEGSRLWDIGGREFVDLNMAYGPLILGHRHPRIVEAVTSQIAERGSQLGFPTEITVRVAEKIKRLFPTMELLRFANSGTEAVASAARLARAYTGRPKVVLFEGHYHGWSEGLFNRYHAPLDDLPAGAYGPAIPGTSGMTRAMEDVIVCRWNDLAALEALLAAEGDQVACAIMEPVMGNAGVVPPGPGYLSGVREATRRHGALLIFDEVITGLRVASGGAQERYDVRPDITVLSKALGGGYPVAAFGASNEIMSLIVDGTVFHGGVFSGNATVMAAAEAVLDEVLADPAAMYGHLHEVGDALAAGLHELMTDLDVPHTVNNVGPMISLFLMEEPGAEVTSYRDARVHGRFDRFIGLQHAVQDRGVFFHPNMFEPMYLSVAHTREDVDLVLERIEAGARASLL